MNLPWTLEWPTWKSRFFLLSALLDAAFIIFVLNRPCQFSSIHPNQRFVTGSLFIWPTQWKVRFIFARKKSIKFYFSDRCIWPMDYERRDKFPNRLDKSRVQSFDSTLIRPIWIESNSDSISKSPSWLSICDTRQRCERDCGKYEQT